MPARGTDRAGSTPAPADDRDGHRKLRPGACGTVRQRADVLWTRLIEDRPSPKMGISGNFPERASAGRARFGSLKRPDDDQCAHQKALTLSIPRQRDPQPRRTKTRSVLFRATQSLSSAVPTRRRCDVQCSYRVGILVSFAVQSIGSAAGSWFAPVRSRFFGG